MSRFALHTVVRMILLLGVASIGFADSPADNLLPNPSFEDQSDGKPLAWESFSWLGTPTFEYAEIGRTGDRSLMISSEEGVDSAWHAKVAVEPRSTYRLSGWIKTENVNTTGNARGALMNLHNIQPTATKAVSGTSDWTRVEVLFETGDQDSVDVNCLFGGWGPATGRAWFDDVRLEKHSMENWKPTLAIDAQEVGEPISKYVYGQFIEHLGRCIYGGIWAEMLEDRKFYYAVGAEKSPWRPFDENSVEMVRQDSFVGDHTPKIAAGHGIRQRGLGLVEGKSYEGYVWLKAAEKTVSVQVSLIWDTGKTDRELQTITLRNVGATYTKYPLKFTAGKRTDDAILAIKSIDGSCFLGTASLMPDDNVQGMRADTLALLKELDSPVYRWPGGNFVSGYDWKDGIGDRDRRPPRKNPAWTGVEHNDMGIDEFMAFCRILDTEPYIAVNSGLGGVKSAVEELQYANGTADTPMGTLRAANGHAEPYRVKWWGIGNEMYGGWQLGNIPLEQYVTRHNEFAEAMRTEDASAVLVAVGDAGKWSEGMMQHCADHMDLISEHFYVQEKPGLIAHVLQVADRVRAKADAHRGYRKAFDSLKGKDIRIALDEWNYWYGPHVFGELGTRYFLKDALGIAAGLNEYARNSDIMFMANYAQTVNVIGCIKTSKTDAAFATTGLVLKLYRQHFGVLPLKVATEHPLDVMAALSEDRNTLTVAVVNPTMRQLEIPLAVEGIKLTGKGRRWEIAGNDPMAYNEPGKKPNVTIEESTVDDAAEQISVAPCSVTLYELAIQHE